MRFLLLASTAALLSPVATLAQTAAPAAETAMAEEELPAGEIIVTATRRAEGLSKIPIAVTAVSMDQLRNSGGNDIRQVAQLAPSLLVSSATNESNGAARIRGIGTVGENPGLESSVAVFIDGVYRSRTGVGLTDLGELERIEILRGPQGTLFGRNASAGLLNITTAMPKFEFGGIAEATYGNFDNKRLMGSLYGPITDKIAFRIDGLWNERDGFLRDVVSGRTLADRNRWLLRGQLLAKPTDDLSIRIIADYNRKDEECCGAVFLPTQNIARDAAGNVVSSPSTIAGIVRSLGGIIPVATDGSRFVRDAAITPGESFNQRTRDWGLSGEVNWAAGGVNITSITAYREFRNKAGQDADFNSLDILRRRDQDRKFATFTQELRLQGTAFNDRLDWLVGGYYADEILKADDDLKYGNDYERYANCVLAESFARGTGQLALINTADVSCFNRPVAAAVAGALPPAAAATAAQIRALSGQGGLIPGRPIDPRGGFYNIASQIGFTPAAGQNLMNNTGMVQNEYRQRSRNYAFFTHNVIKLVPDKLSLTLGLRYTNELKFLDARFDNNNAFCGALRASPLAALANLPCVINGTSGPGISRSQPGGRFTEERLTGTAVLTWTPTRDLLTYASYSRGYKAGGYNLDAAALNAANPQATDLTFAAEDVDSFEIGAKLNVKGFRLNAALFYQEFTNFQLNTFNGVNFEVANIGGCRDNLGGRDRDLIAGNSACAANRVGPGLISQGVELEAFLTPVRNVNLGLGYTYADSRFAGQLTGTRGSSLAPTLFQLPGQLISNASPHVITANAAWTPQINDTLSALFYVDYRHMSDFNTGSDRDFEKEEPGFGVMNARVGLYGPNRIWGVELWAQNLTNTAFAQISADAPLQGGGTFQAVARGLQPNANGLFIAFPAEPRTYGITLRSMF
jgi:outer membrane receptor protein involved in Fe transport